MTDITETDGALGRKLVADMERLTLDRNGEKILANITRNMAHLDRGRSLAKLRTQALGDGGSAIVIAAGPSMRRLDPLGEIKKLGYSGCLLATESAMAYCLQNDVVPDLVVSLDPDATRIVRWFGDPNLTEDALQQDDYYRRQDMDEFFADEMRANREMLELLDRHGPGMRIALCTSASKAVVDRVLEIGMEIYWWNPMLDDPDGDDSRTTEIQALNGLPCVNAGGNVGAACWMMAQAVLQKSKVALTGMDFSYYDDTPFSQTQYYNEIVELVGEENLESVFMRMHNPFVDAFFYTDPAYMWYREAFLSMAAEADCETYNCTGGGILFGDAVAFVTLEKFIRELA